MFENDLTIFTGHFGSGKSEVAINYAIKNLGKIKKIVIDLDIINPFFKISDAEDALKNKGISLIKPVFSNTNVDVPAISPGVSVAIQNKSFEVIIDLGGDDVGAKILSMYKDYINKRKVNFICVINIFRLTTSNANGIKNIIKEIETTTGFKINGLINNTNLMNFTKENHILEGHEIINKVSNETGIPILYTSFMKNMIFTKENELNTKILYMDKYIRTPIN